MRQSEFSGTVTEVNAVTGMVHIADKSMRYAASFRDRTGRFGSGDRICVRGYMQFGDLAPELHQKFDISETEAKDWRWAEVHGIRVVEHKVRPTILDQKPESQPMTVSNNHNEPVWIKALRGTYWRHQSSGAVVEIESLYQDSKSRWQCSLKYHSRGSRLRMFQRLSLSTITNEYSQVDQPDAVQAQQAVI